MRILYTVLLYLLLPFILLRLVWKARGNSEYLQGVPDRLGFCRPIERASNQANIDSVLIWVHAVSVGEVNAALPLIKSLQEKVSNSTILVTTTTPTGRERLRIGQGIGVEHRFLPYDTPDAVFRFLNRTQPASLIVIETELWPNLFAACGHRNIPIIIANARLSEKSYKGYSKFSNLTFNMLQHVKAVAAQSEMDMRRFLKLGVNPNSIVVTGNVKFDIPTPASLRERSNALRRRFGSEKNVFIAASTHDGEELLLLNTFENISKEIKNCLMILVPRHPERASQVLALSVRRKYNSVLYSYLPDELTKTDIIVVDSMGLLPLLYGASDVAFVGGSLVPTGGHNMLEPAAIGCPVIFGPHVFNFADISKRLRDSGAAQQVADVHELAEVIKTLLNDPNQRYLRGEKGMQFVEQNRGALDNIINVIIPHVQVGST